MKVCASFFLLLFIVFSALSQEQTVQKQGASFQAQNSSQKPEVIDLTTKSYTISARMELPRVKIFDKRIIPNFKEVSVEKSFISELSTESENIQFEPITSGKVKPIPNIEALLKKKRF